MKISFPCMNIIMVPRDKIRANNYNPNSVPHDKMELLKQSIIDNGFCYPVIVVYDEGEDVYIIIDGFHRYTICGKEWLDIEMVPIIVLSHDISKRMAATIQFNKARGVHQVDLDADLVRSLIQQGMSDEEISIHLGIDFDTIYRYKQLTGMADLFKNISYSLSWDMREENVG